MNRLLFAGTSSELIVSEPKRLGFCEHRIGTLCILENRNDARFPVAG